MSSMSLPSGRWVVLKPYDVLKTGDEFYALFWVRNPQGINEYRFSFYGKGREPFDIETYGFHLVTDSYVCWMGPEIEGINNDDVRSALRCICSSPFECQKGDADYLCTLGPLETKAWEYLIGHEPARRYLAEIARHSKPTALPFFTALHQDKSNPSPATTLEVLAALGSSLALPMVIEKLKQKDPISRRYAYQMLEHFEGPEVDALLQDGLRDTNWNIQKVVEALIAKRKK